jgi:hypothetical protein
MAEKSWNDKVISLLQSIDDTLKGEFLGKTYQAAWAETDADDYITLFVEVSPEQYQMFKAAADACGKSVEAWATEAIVTAARRDVGDTEMQATDKLTAIKSYTEYKMLECMRADKVHDFLVYQDIHEFIVNLG